MMQKAGIGWIGLATYVAAYDLYAAKTGRETLSRTFYNSFKHPAQRWGVIAAWGITTLHLFGALPDEYDPFDRLGALIVRKS